MAMAELLDVLPEDHPARPKILALFKDHATGLIANQGHAGLWHQLLDRRESYEETSASAMYVFAIARGIYSSTKFLTIRLNVASSGRSMFTPPTRVQLVWKRWPDMNSTMS